MEEKTSKLQVINQDMLKLIAIVPMTIGHFCSYLSEGAMYADIPFVVFVLMHSALFAPPIFFFFITEGYRYTRSRKKYALRIVVFAIITQIAFSLAGYETIFSMSFFAEFNIFFTLLIGLFALMIWDSKWKLPVRITLIVLLDILTVLLSSEWMIFGVVIMLVFYILHDQPKKRFIAFTSTILVHQILISTLSFCGWKWTLLTVVVQFSACMLSYFVISKCYNGAKGNHPLLAKWFFYIFYPAHLIVIYLVKVMI